MIFKYDLDQGSLSDLTSFELMQFAPLTYCSMVYKFKEVATLLVTIVIPAVLGQMKSTKTSDLMFFRALFMFKIWALLSSIKFFLLSLLIETITCFLDRSFMIMLIQGFGLLFPLNIL